MREGKSLSFGIANLIANDPGNGLTVMVDQPLGRSTRYSSYTLEEPIVIVSDWSSSGDKALDNLLASEGLVRIMRDASADLDIRIGAAEGLGYTGFIIARDALYDVMTDSTYPSELRAAAAKALGRTLGACE